MNFHVKCRLGAFVKPGVKQKSRMKFGLALEPRNWPFTPVYEKKARV